LFQDISSASILIGKQTKARVCNVKNWQNDAHGFCFHRAPPVSTGSGDRVTAEKAGSHRLEEPCDHYKIFFTSGSRRRIDCHPMEKWLE
jgi:hypothetical protein